MKSNFGFMLSFLFVLPAFAQEETYLRNYTLQNYKKTEGQARSQKDFHESLSASIEVNETLPYLKDCKCTNNITQMGNAQQYGLKIVKGSCPQFKGFVPITIRPRQDSPDEDFIPVSISREEENGEKIIRLTGYYSSDKSDVRVKRPRSVDQEKTEIVLIESTPKNQSDLGLQLSCKHSSQLKVCESSTNKNRKVELRSLDFANSSLYLRGIDCGWRPASGSNKQSAPDYQIGNPHGEPLPTGGSR